MDGDFNTDEALLSLGRLGRWQIISYLYMASILCTSACFAMLQVVFIGEARRGGGTGEQGQGYREAGGGGTGEQGEGYQGAGGGYRGWRRRERSERAVEN